MEFAKVLLFKTLISLFFELINLNNNMNIKVVIYNLICLFPQTYKNICKIIISWNTKKINSCFQTLHNYYCKRQNWQQLTKLQNIQFTIYEQCTDVVATCENPGGKNSLRG